ncbi:hypothetical protein BDL97_10G100900 [Sphagnum fallax]|nr:hypothetical protein BDL97_10G100900 [Sphagnum fallax]
MTACVNPLRCWDLVNCSRPEDLLYLMLVMNLVGAWLEDPEIAADDLLIGGEQTAPSKRNLSMSVELPSAMGLGLSDTVGEAYIPWSFYPMPYLFVHIEATQGLGELWPKYLFSTRNLGLNQLLLRLLRYLFNHIEDTQGALQLLPQAHPQYLLLPLHEELISFTSNTNSFMND